MKRRLYQQKIVINVSAGNITCMRYLLRIKIISDSKRENEMRGQTQTDVRNSQFYVSFKHIVKSLKFVLFIVEQI